jgi:hypothetical protein
MAGRLEGFGAARSCARLIYNANGNCAGRIGTRCALTPIGPIIYILAAKHK